ncbi:MAG TPA: flagellar hook-associated protein FlgK, partial [Sporomusaceae bacterium]|nr:flagellar hook-associated protein FlgK [Sporomusaceae bacterium]
MRSTFAGFNTVVRGIFAQQASLDTVGHNIANANTDGYSRQNVNLSTTRPEVVYGGAAGKMQLGTGVTAQSVTRARDSFIDSQMWKESGALGYGQMNYDTLSRIEGIFKDTAETGMQAVLNKFWSAWQTLSTTASDEGTRTALRQRGVEMVDTIQHSSQQLKDVVGDLNSVI